MEIRWHKQFPRPSQLFDDVAIATPVAGRGQPELDPLIGMFVNTLVLRTVVESDSSFADLLDAAREVDISVSPLSNTLPIRRLGLGGDHRSGDRRFVARIDPAGQQRLARQALHLRQTERDGIGSGMRAHAAISFSSRP